MRSIRTMARAAVSLFVCLLAAATGTLAAEGGSPGSDWPSYNGNPEGTRFSSLAQITPSNAAHLKHVCSVSLREQGPNQSGPVVIDGRMYVTTFHDTYAVDAGSCKVIWRDQHKPASVEPYNTNRGVAVAGNVLVRGHQDGHLVAYDKRSGKMLWNTAVLNGKLGEFFSAAPSIWHGTIFEGAAGSDWGIKGRMYAFDLATGKMKWSFSTIASQGWTARSSATGGGGTWVAYTIDPATGDLYVPVANPSPDYVGAYRPGSNLYTNSVVVLSGATGKLKWYFQATPHDVHDWDVASPPVLYTDTDGKPMFGLATKAGLIYGVDRTAHRPVFETAGTRRVNVDAPITVQGTRFCPGLLGGTEWNGSSYDETNHRLVTPMNDWCMALKLAPLHYVPGAFFYGATIKPDAKIAGGHLTSIDASTGKIAWNYHSTSMMIAGVTPTAGGVIFTGDMDGHFLVFESAGGKVLFKQMTPSGAVAGGVVTYLVNGKQHVALTSGNVSRAIWGVSGHPSIVVYAL